ncbi:MFS transporter [Neisseria sicca]|uniref:MFS transporter n=1 Tax=Neisseria sicca TaxID=490 RepID=UPI000664D842|nr:MFS transporter [Neisseria sicca]
MKQKNRPAAILPLGLLFAVALLATTLRAPLAALGPLIGMIQADLRASGTFMGITAALPMLAFALFSPLAPKAARRFGMERVLAASLALMIIGMICRSLGPSESLLAGGTLLLAAAIAMGNVLLPALAKRNLPDLVGLVVGTLSVAMALSSALAASVSVPLAEYMGWQWSLAVWLLPATVALCVWLTIARRAGAERPSENMLSDGLTGNIWRLRPAWCLSAFMGLQSLLFYSLVNFLPSMLMEKGIGNAAAGNYVALFQIGSLAGSLSVSFLFARINHRQWFNLSLSLIMLASILGLWLMPAGTAPLWIFLVGAGTSGCFSATLMLSVFRSSDSHTAAALSGMAQTVGYSIAATGPLGMGMLYDVSGSWSASLSVLSVLILAECVLAWFAARPDIIR